MSNLKQFSVRTPNLNRMRPNSHHNRVIVYILGYQADRLSPRSRGRKNGGRVCSEDKMIPRRLDQSFCLGDFGVHILTIINQDPSVIHKRRRSPCSSTHTRPWVGSGIASKSNPSRKFLPEYSSVSLYGEWNLPGSIACTTVTSRESSERTKENRGILQRSPMSTVDGRNERPRVDCGTTTFK